MRGSALSELCIIRGFDCTNNTKKYYTYTSTIRHLPETTLLATKETIYNNPGSFKIHNHHHVQSQNHHRLAPPPLPTTPILFLFGLPIFSGLSFPPPSLNAAIALLEEEDSFFNFDKGPVIPCKGDAN
jgi:hypothetical protein